MARDTTLRRLRIAVALLAAAALVPVGGALAATPAAGTITETTRTLGYTGGPFVAPNRTDPLLGDGTTLTCAPEASPCDDFALTVDLPPDFLREHPDSQLSVNLTADNGRSDYDLYVLDEKGDYAAIGYNAGATESVEFDAREGAFTVRAVPFSARAGAYTATVALLAPDPTADADGDGVPNPRDACPGTPSGDAADAEGCAGTEAPVPSDPGRPRVVVADLDSAINPYHDFYYQRPSVVTQEVLDELGVQPRNVVRLTRTGRFAADRAADAGFWSGVQRGELYHFLGTNIVATSFADEDSPEPYLKPTAGKNPHGVGTSAAVLTASPDAVILFVEAQDALGSAESHDFAFTHPAVDVVTTSYGVSLGFGLVPVPEYRAFEHSYEGVVKQGKLHFSSGGNGPGVTALRGGAGPWWSIGVSGIEEGSSEGDTVLSGNLPDFVSDFTQTLPYCMTCESGTTSVGGTSFSTPRSAGLASRVLLDVRRALDHEGGIRDVGGRPVMASDAPGGRKPAARCGTAAGTVGKDKPAPPGRAHTCTTVTNWQLRRALEQAAWVPDTAAYQPGQAAGGGIGAPVNPVAPWLQTAWGDLTVAESKGVPGAALAELGFGGDKRAKAAGFCAFQTGVVRARKAWWDRVAPTLPDNPVFTGETPPGPPARDPFVYC